MSYFTLNDPKTFPSLAPTTIDSKTPLTPLLLQPPPPKKMSFYGPSFDFLPQDVPFPKPDPKPDAEPPPSSVPSSPIPSTATASFSPKLSQLPAKFLSSNDDDDMCSSPIKCHSKHTSITSVPALAGSESTDESGEGGGVFKGGGSPTRCESLASDSLLLFR